MQIMSNSFPLLTTQIPVNLKLLDCIPSDIIPPNLVPENLFHHLWEAPRPTYITFDDFDFLPVGCNCELEYFIKVNGTEEFEDKNITLTEVRNSQGVIQKAIKITTQDM